jgi:hypothetical protein
VIVSSMPAGLPPTWRPLAGLIAAGLCASVASALQVGAFGDPGRDPRGWCVSVAFAALVPSTELGVKAADDAQAREPLLQLLLLLLLPPPPDVLVRAAGCLPHTANFELSLPCPALYCITPAAHPLAPCRQHNGLTSPSCPGWHLTTS